MRPGARAGLLAVLALALLGCSSRFEAFSFQAASGANIEIRQSPRRAPAEESRFKPTSAGASSPLYTLASPVAAGESGQALALSYTSSIPDCRLTVFSDRRKPLSRVALPPSSGTRLRFLVPLPAGSRVWGYQLSVPSGSSPTGTLELLGAGTGSFVHGFAIEGDGLTVDGSVAVLAASPGSVAARLTSATREEMQGGAWVIRIALQPGAAGATVSFADPEGKNALFDVNPASTPSVLDFARGSMDFLPMDVKVIGAMESLQVLRVAADAPLPADPGLILTWDRSSWRRPDFELYSWSRFPRVLILDTASYDVQDGIFNRLAFFVEKTGHAGRIEPPQSLAGIHGYNAHDYKSDDLARFFTTAAKEGIALTPEEGELANVLVENGVIVKTADGYEKGDGSVLSLSRSSSAVLRDLLLTHEAFHGAYFALPSFRDATEKEWAALTPVERQVWTDFLASRAYDTTDHYLVVNEFQSYLLQQERRAVWGFQGQTLSRMSAESPQKAALVRRLLASRPDSFLRSFDVLDAALQSAGGPPGGLAISIRKLQ